MKKTISLVLTVLIIAVLFTACANFDFAEDGQYIVTPKEVLKLVDDGAILVDAQSAENYNVAHIDGAVNVPMSALVVNEPYANLLGDKDLVESVMSTAGITENDLILVYDDASNMQAARIQWTLNMYSNFNVRVVSGGIEALKEADMAVSSTPTTLAEASYTAGDVQKTLIVNLDYVKAQINNPDDNTVIIDTRSIEEYLEGTIPGAVHMEYILNNYGNGEYKSARDIQNTYLNCGITPDMKIILFCKTSVRATQTYSALKNAGYQDVRIYDGAWLEFSAEESPQVPSENTAPVKGDAS